MVIGKNNSMIKKPIHLSTGKEEYEMSTLTYILIVFCVIYLENLLSHILFNQRHLLKYLML